MIYGLRARTRHRTQESRHDRSALLNDHESFSKEQLCATVAIVNEAQVIENSVVSLLEEAMERTDLPVFVCASKSSTPRGTVRLKTRNESHPKHNRSIDADTLISSGGCYQARKQSP